MPSNLLASGLADVVRRNSERVAMIGNGDGVAWWLVTQELGVVYFFPESLWKSPLALS